MIYYGMMGGLGGMIVFWILFVGLIVWLIIQNDSRGRENMDKDPEEITMQRYASGHITKKEFEEIRKSLRGEK